MNCCCGWRNQPIIPRIHPLGAVVFPDPDEFVCIYEPLDVKSKKIHVVDSGLTYNLPYPLILRPQRGVDLIISFDFSARPSDTSPPFKVGCTCALVLNASRSAVAHFC